MKYNLWSISVLFKNLISFFNLFKMRELKVKKMLLSIQMNDKLLQGTPIYFQI